MQGARLQNLFIWQREKEIQNKSFFLFSVKLIYLHNKIYFFKSMQLNSSLQKKGGESPNCRLSLSFPSGVLPTLTLHIRYQPSEKTQKEKRKKKPPYVFTSSNKEVHTGNPANSLLLSSFSFSIRLLVFFFGYLLFESVR